MAVRGPALLLVLALALSVPSPIAAQPPGGDPDEPGWSFGFELKTSYRDTDEARFLNPFPFSPEMLPPGQSRGFLEAVEPGSHFEVPVFTLWLIGRWGEHWSAKVKLDLIDRHDRNPTSTDDEWDLDELWIRWGEETEPGFFPAAGRGVYAKLGKIPKFERQDDRHLESYGLISTAFNRFEDVGLEVGFDLARWLYLKASFTQGNPVFLRDPNALAGDNGIPLLDGSVPNPDPELGSGIPILYDTDPDEINFDNPELGVGVGFRTGDEVGYFALDFLVWAYDRELADVVDLDGTFYGADLDLLFGPLNIAPLPVTDSDKREVGANLWLYAGDFSFFGQFVDQELAGLPRTGFEVEVAWSFDLPLFATAFGRQLFPYVAPAIRYSELDPDFTDLVTVNAADDDPTNDNFLPYPAPNVF
jgi:hypothetical protein